MPKSRTVNALGQRSFGQFRRDFAAECIISEKNVSDAGDENAFHASRELGGSLKSARLRPLNKRIDVRCGDPFQGRVQGHPPEREQNAHCAPRPLRPLR